MRRPKVSTGATAPSSTGPGAVKSDSIIAVGKSDAKADGSRANNAGNANGSEGKQQQAISPDVSTPRSLNGAVSPTFGLADAGKGGQANAPASEAAKEAAAKAGFDT